MPGYLSHLAVRVFGAKPAVRPRLPSLFESAPGTMTLAVPESSVVRVVEQERLAPPPASAATVAPAAPIDFAPAARPTPTVAHERQTLAEKPDRRTVEPEAQKSPAPAMREPLQPADATAAAPHPRRAPVVLRPEQRPIEGMETAPPMRERPAPPSLHSELKPQRQSSDELPLAVNLHLQPDQPRMEPAHPVAERAPVTAPPGRSLAPLVAPQPEARPAQPTPAFVDPAAQDSPSVQVSIGRLIVEALMPAAAPAAMPASRAPAPRLSLDDYLRQRRSQA